MAETMAGQAPPADDRLTTLTVFSRALGREAHVLRERPEILWQQLYNRLQWEPTIARLLDRVVLERTKEGAAPWIRNRSPSPESRALVRTLGHGGNSNYPFTCCAVWGRTTVRMNCG